MSPKDKEEDKEDEEDEDDYEDPLNLFKMFDDPKKILKNLDIGKVFNSEQFQNIFKEIFNQISKNLPKDLQGLSPEDISKAIWKNRNKYFKGPIMFGFNITSGPDGKPTIDSFGTIKPETRSGKTKVKKEREPLVEVNEDETQLIIIAEMPGVTRNDIELKANTYSLTISTKPTSNRKYFKEIKLPTAIDSNYAKARYVNGILEIKLKKLDERKTNIEIEE